MERGRAARAALVGRWLFAATVIGSVMAMGSLVTTALVVSSVGAAISCVLLWISPPHRVTSAARWLLLAWAILTFATVLQAIPLPAGLVKVIAPANADLWERALTPFGQAAPAWHPISTAPPATQIEVLRGVFYGLLLLGGISIASDEGGVKFLEWLVIVAASAVALVSIAHAAVDAKLVFGIYKPRELYAFAAGRYGPILNVNQLTAYINVGACVALGVLLSRKPSIPRPLALSLAVMLTGTSVWAASRGGMAALAIGVLATVGLALYARKKFATVRAELVIPLGIVVAAGAMIGLGLSESARDELASRDVTKIVIAKNAIDLVRMSPWVGVGRGAFEGVFPIVRNSIEYVTFTHPENILAQWTSEWGIPVSILGAGTIAWALRPSVVLAAARPPVAAWVAIVVSVLHDLVDFHLETPGIAAIVVVCAAIVVGARTTVRTERKPGEQRRMQLVTFAAAALVVPLVLLALRVVGHSIAEDRNRLSDWAQDAKVPRERFRAEMRGAMERYPAEAFFPLMGAVRAQLFGQDEIMPWIERALEINPRFGRAHFVLARQLANRYRAQARLEYRLAYESDMNLREAILKESPRLAGDADDAFQLVPAGPDGIDVLENLAEALQHRLPSSVVRIDAELESRQHEAPGVLRRRAAAALSDYQHSHAWCGARSACADAAVAASRAVVARDPTSCDARKQVAKTLVAVGNPVGAFDELERSIDAVKDKAACERGLVMLALETKQARRADVALERILRGGCGAADECVELYEWAAEVEEGRQRSAAAIALYKRAAQLRPDRWELTLRAGDVALGAGLYGDAVDAYSSLVQRFPSDARFAAGLSQARAGLDERRLKAAPAPKPGLALPEPPAEP
ncbi:MAG: O-antigen ligase family protein [Deltaproteobacteria bacterium]|nr:O-antigen ligase family protein [Deltaproteobacteria bacterium]